MHTSAVQRQLQLQLGRNAHESTWKSKRASPVEVGLVVAVGKGVADQVEQGHVCGQVELNPRKRRLRLVGGEPETRPLPHHILGPPFRAPCSPPPPP